MGISVRLGVKLEKNSNYNELELPLLIKSIFISATANCKNVITNCNNIS
jgi:hypothetical protein